MKQILLNYLNSENPGADKAAHDLVYLTISSAEYAVQR
jgi:hypothetical protein